MKKKNKKVMRIQEGSGKVDKARFKSGRNLLNLGKWVCKFILVINQLDAQNFVLQLVYFMPVHVSSTM